MGHRSDEIEGDGILFRDLDPIEGHAPRCGDD
jgi:hypothetical protein